MNTIVCLWMLYGYEQYTERTPGSLVLLKRWSTSSSLRLIRLWVYLFSWKTLMMLWVIFAIFMEDENCEHASVKYQFRFNSWILVWWQLIWFLSNTHWINHHSAVRSGLEGYQEKYPGRLIYDTNQNPFARPRMSTKDGVLQTLTTGVSGLWSTSHQRCMRQLPRTYLQIADLY